VGYADLLLGEVVDRLKRDGNWDESLVVVAADHGGALIEDEPRRDASERTIGEVASVPLFIKAPGQARGRVVDRPFCSTAVLPEIARIIEAGPPWRTDGCERERVVVDNGTGDRVSVPVGEARRQRQAYVDRVARLFGGDTGWPAVMRLGPASGLIGDAVPAPARQAPPAGTALPDRSGDKLSTFRPDRARNDVLRQRGKMEGTGPGTQVAVAVNGTIAATGIAFDDAGEARYSILLPPWSLRPGRNRIEYFAVTPGTDSTGGPGPVLSPLAVPADQ
jgi:arylsulfatase A-like enzyme